MFHHTCGCDCPVLHGLCAAVLPLKLPLCAQESPTWPLFSGWTMRERVIRSTRSWASSLWKTLLRKSSSRRSSMRQTCIVGTFPQGAGNLFQKLGLDNFATPTMFIVFFKGGKYALQSFVQCIHFLYVLIQCGLMADLEPSTGNGAEDNLGVSPSKDKHTQPYTELDLQSIHLHCLILTYGRKPKDAENMKSPEVHSWMQNWIQSSTKPPYCTDAKMLW